MSALKFLWTCGVCSFTFWASHKQKCPNCGSNEVYT